MVCGYDTWRESNLIRIIGISFNTLAIFWLECRRIVPGVGDSKEDDMQLSAALSIYTPSNRRRLLIVAAAMVLLVAAADWWTKLGRRI
jgi:hypothetical protein